MTRLVLTPDEMAAADAQMIARGTSGAVLMRRAGDAVARFALSRCSDADGFDVLVGPGNNGGDGYLVARFLSDAFADVAVFASGAPKSGSEAAGAAAQWRRGVKPLAEWRPHNRRVVVDALFGAGLSRPLAGTAAAAARSARDAGVRVLAIDVPSGLDGATGLATGPSFAANWTVTFAALKPGHLLADGPDLCGAIEIADIGIDRAALCATGCTCHANGPAAWHDLFPRPARTAHKYARGHVAVFSGGPISTGAARLAARAAARAGAGAVTVLSPSEALAANAAHLTATMLVACDGPAEARSFLERRKVAGTVVGPGFGRGEPARDMVAALLASPSACVLDADALTSFEENPQELFHACAGAGMMPVMTPHEGEFRRLFPDLTDQPSKLERARRAAQASGAVIVYKGPDTVIAAPDGRAAINVNGVPWLATAGSGDTLAGILAGLMAQMMPPFEAACAAVWLHAEAGRRFGPGLIAEDIADQLPPILRELLSPRH